MSCHLSRGLRKAKTRKMKVHKGYYKTKEEIIDWKQRNCGYGEPLPDLLKDRPFTIRLF